jgi:hypothetical protein
MSAPSVVLRRSTGQSYVLTSCTPTRETCAGLGVNEPADLRAASPRPWRALTWSTAGNVARHTGDQPAPCTLNTSCRVSGSGPVVDRLVSTSAPSAATQKRISAHGRHKTASSQDRALVAERRLVDEGPQAGDQKNGLVTEALEVSSRAFFRSKEPSSVTRMRTGAARNDTMQSSAPPDTDAVFEMSVHGSEALGASTTASPCRGWNPRAAMRRMRSRTTYHWHQINQDR